MKNKRNIAIIVSLIVMALVVTACGASSNTSSSMGMSYAVSSTAPMVAPQMDMVKTDGAYEYGNGSDSMTNTTLQSNRVNGTSSDKKIIRTMYVSLETLEFDKTVDDLLALVNSLGGYVESQNTSGVSLYDKGGYSSRSGYFQLRIPSDKLDTGASQLNEIGNITSKNENAQDVTSSYTDVERRIETLKVQEDRLLELLAKAENIEDLIVLESKLADVRYEIESYTSQLNQYDKVIEYSLLTVNVTEVVIYSDIKTEPKNFGERISEAFASSWENFVKRCQNFVVEFILLIPTIIIVAVVAVVVFIIVRRKMKKLKANKVQAIAEEKPKADENKN